MIYIPPTLCAPHESNIKLCRLDSLLIHFLGRKKKFSHFFEDLLVTSIISLNVVDVAGLFVVDWKRLIEDVLMIFYGNQLATPLLIYLIHKIAYNLIHSIITKEIADCTSFRFLMMILEQTKYDFIL